MPREMRGAPELCRGVVRRREAFSARDSATCEAGSPRPRARAPDRRPRRCAHRVGTRHGACALRKAGARRRAGARLAAPAALCSPRQHAPLPGRMLLSPQSSLSAKLAAPSARVAAQARVCRPPRHSTAQTPASRRRATMPRGHRSPTAPSDCPSAPARLPARVAARPLANLQSAAPCLPPRISQPSPPCAAPAPSPPSPRRRARAPHVALRPPPSLSPPPPSALTAARTARRPLPHPRRSSRPQSPPPPPPPPAPRRRRCGARAPSSRQSWAP